MTYEEAREFIQNSNRYGIVPGLGTITELLNRLGNPQEQLKIIHVAGTNGKGSTSTFITSILATAGYKVGRYLSPAVFCYEERIQIANSENISKNNNIKNNNIKNNNNKNDNNKKDNNQKDKYYKLRDGYLDNNRIENNYSVDNTELDIATSDIKADDSIRIEYITREGICKAIEKIQPICEAMLKEGLPHPTSFEIETAMAMLYLLWEEVEVAVIEVGMGGTLDATNIIQKPVCCVITSISMDHMQYLGPTLEEIAANKAGIIKYGVPVVTCRQEPRVLTVLQQTCQDKNTTLKLSEYDQIQEVHYSTDHTTFLLSTDQGRMEYHLRMLGEYQVENAVLAIAVAGLLQRQGFLIEEAAITRGLLVSRWSGRFERIARNPDLIIDGAHNEAAAAVLRSSIEMYFTNRRIIYMIGVLADKDYKKILELTVPLADLIITLTPDNSRALASSELAKEVRLLGKPAIDAGTVSEAVRIAFKEADQEDVILAFGSLSFLGDLVNSLDIRKDDETYDR